LAEVERDLTGRHALVVGEFLQQQGLKPDAVDVIGFHGHTVLHAPERRTTVQIGDGGALAQTTGIDVVYDLRAADVGAGGQGAPLAPVYHRALAARLSDRPLAVLNIGGVANVTWIGGDGTLIAFDTGPGNALLDDWMVTRAGQAFDDGGRLAASGTVSEDALIELLTNGYFGRCRPSRSIATRSRCSQWRGWRRKTVPPRSPPSPRRRSPAHAIIFQRSRACGSYVAAGGATRR
jgi:anhydro-N-acetylmuramic acid kinase